MRESGTEQDTPRCSAGGDSKRRISALILAAGQGTRLLPLTRWLAKPAVPFLGRPLIHYALDLVTELGPGSIVVNLHHLPETVVAAVGRYRSPGVAEGELSVAYSEEADILGTAGAIRQARRWLDGDHTVVINGKIYSEVGLCEALDLHCTEEALVTLVVVPFEAGSPFNPVRVGPDGEILGFGPRGPGRPYTFTGIQILKSEVLDQIPAGRSDLVKDLYPALIGRKRRLQAFVSDRFWCECSTPWRYLQGSLTVRKRRSDSPRPAAPSFRQRGLIAAAGCSIGTGSEVQDSILWEDVRVGRNCRVSNAIICSGVQIPDHTRLSHAIATPRIDPGSVSTRVHPVEEEDYLVWPLSPE